MIIHINLIPPETRGLGLHFFSDSMHLSSNPHCGLQKPQHTGTKNTRCETTI